MLGTISRFFNTIFRSRWVRELVDFLFIFGGVFLLGVIVLNYKELQYERNDYMYGDLQKQKTKEIATTITDIEQGFNKKTISFLDNIPPLKSIQIHDYKLDEYLHSKVDKETLAFNMYPPDDRIIIESLGINAPIINVPYASEEKLEKADFKEELTKGVVKYPFTLDPANNQKGSSLFFGHSSVDLREKDNPYGYIFRKLAKIEHGKTIDIIWKGKRYRYQVDKKEVVSPKKVGETLKTYNDAKYATLMSCYPLYTSRNRMLVRAKFIGNKKEKFAMK